MRKKPPATQLATLSDEGRNKGGRPRKTVDWKVFDALCSIQATIGEMCAEFEMDEDTLNAICKREKGTGFSDYAGQKRQKGFVNVRRRQFQLALKGDRTMLIWLGKQYLGQSDKTQNEISGKNGGAIPLAMVREILAADDGSSDD